MEAWQQDVITKNYSRLLQCTIVRTPFLAILLEHRAIHTTELNDITAYIETHQSRAALEIYRIVQTRRNGFPALMAALRETSQDGALGILEDAVRAREAPQIPEDVPAPTPGSSNTARPRRTTSVPQRSDIDVIGLLDRGHELLNPEDIPEEVILLLGNTGSGKTTFAQTIAGDLSKLRVISSGPRGKSCYILDEEEKISRPSILSRTFLPELLHLSENVYMYDCPGFNDTRGPEEDVAANYFLNQIIKHAKSVKFIFVVSYTTMQERIDFPLLAKHATQFIADVPKYSKSIGIVFTKAPNFSSNTGEYIEKEDIIEDIVEFLRICKADFQTSLRKCNVDEKGMVEEQLEFVNCLLSRHEVGDVTSPLYFSRVPKTGGGSLLVDCDNAKYTRDNVGAFLERLEYSTICPADFRYTVKAEAYPHLQKVVETVNQDIASKMQVALQEFCGWFKNEKLSDDSLTVTHRAKSTYDTWSKLNNCVVALEEQQGTLEPMQYYTLVAASMRTAGYNRTESLEGYFQRRKGHFSFLDEVSSRKVIRNVDHWARPVREALENIEVVRNWYDLCSRVETKVHSYSFQANRPEMGNPKTGEEMLNFVNANVLTVEDHVKQKVAQLRPVDLEQLLHIMTFGMRKTEVLIENESVTVVGNFVRFGELVEGGGTVAAGRLHVFSLHSVFVDVDIRHSGLQVTVVSPNIYVIGGRIVDVSGCPGAKIVPDEAASGVNAGEHGVNGAPGNPGYPGGPVCVFTNNIEDARYLKVVSNGGSGGKGQSGGHGVDGKDGRNATEDDATTRTTYDDVGVFHRERWKHPGFQGDNGGNGGHGGVGGLGAAAGEVTVTCFNNDAGVQIFTSVGETEEGGRGGKGGRGGRNGHGYHLHIKKSAVGRLGREASIIEPNPPFAPNGSNGLDNHVSDGRQSPPSPSHINTNSLKIQCSEKLQEQSSPPEITNVILEMLNRF